MKKSRCVLWAGGSYGPVRLMDRCVLWAGRYGMYITVVGMHASHFTSSTVALAHNFVCNYKDRAAPLDAMKA